MFGLTVTERSPSRSVTASATAPVAASITSTFVWYRYGSVRPCQRCGLAMVMVWTVCAPAAAPMLTAAEVVSATTVSVASVTTVRIATLRALLLLFQYLVVTSTVAEVALTLRCRRYTPGPALSSIRTDSGSTTQRLTLR